MTALEVLDKMGGELDRLAKKADREAEWAYRGDEKTHHKSKARAFREAIAVLDAIRKEVER